MVKTISSSDDLRIYDDNKHYKIYAGPGAGKTHLLRENIKFIIANSNKIKNSYRKILCITYTNAAADEIRRRLGSYGKYVVVSTIHAFLNEYVIKPFQIQLKQIIKKEFNYSIPAKTKITSQQEGASLLSGHQKETIYEFIRNKYPDIDPTLYDQLSKTKMATVLVDIQLVNAYPYVEEETIKLTYDNKIDNWVAKAIKEYTWSEAGRLAFDEILYFGLRLIENYQHIAHILRVEFPYLLIDEYQDTNPIQNKIIRKIAEKECIVAAIGDIAQSIYSFQGATYQEFVNFWLNSQLPVESYIIDGNSRSTQNIIDLINFIRKNDRNLSRQKRKDIKQDDGKDENEKITFIIQNKHSKRSITAVLKELTNDRYTVLCRKWAEVFDYVEDISDGQRKLLNSINSGYSYVMRRPLETEIQAKQEPWIESLINISELEDTLRRKCIPSALKILGNYFDVSGILKQHDGKKYEEFKALINFWEVAFGNIDGNSLLKDVIASINESMKDSGLTILEHFRYPKQEDDDYFEVVYKYVDKLEYSAARKIIKEIFAEDSKYMTIHKSKGTEHDVVVVNMEPFREEKILPVDVICNPVVFSENNEIRGYEEFTRIFYVACSRAKYKLYIHINGDETTENGIRKVLDSYCESSGISNGFYDVIFIS